MKLKSIFLALLFFHSIALFAQQIEWKDILGTFEFSLEHGSYVEITFNKGSTFSNKNVHFMHGPTLTDIYTGSFTFQDNHVRLTPKEHFESIQNYDSDTLEWQDSNYNISKFPISKTFFVTTYQSNLYLLSYDTITNDFIHFINDINAQYDWEIGSLKKSINYDTSINNIPLPKEWKERIKIIPLEAKIIEVKEWKPSEVKYFDILNAPITTTYVINKGIKDNVFVGMTFWHTDRFCDLKILEVHENYSIASAFLSKKCSCKKGFILSSKYLREN